MAALTEVEPEPEQLAARAQHGGPVHLAGARVFDAEDVVVLKLRPRRGVVERNEGAEELDLRGGERRVGRRPSARAGHGG
jgi:hypothetical protein